MGNRPYSLRKYLSTLPAVWYRNAFFLLLILIWTVSSIPSLPEPEIKGLHIEIRLDYLFHLGQYFVLVLAGISWQYRKSPTSLLKSTVIMMILITILATADEFHQKLIPGRTFNPTDNLFNVIGVCLGSLTGYFFWFRYKTSE